MNSSPASASQVDFTKQTHRKIALEFELKMLQMYGPTLGIYALPSLTDENTWNGIVFVRNGFYKDGKFKFTMRLQDFPLRQPRIFFCSKMQHPLVDEVTGELDVVSTLAEMWNYYSENMLYNLMKDMKKMFIDKSQLSNRFSYNPKMAELFESNHHEFILKALQSVDCANDKLKENDRGWILTASEMGTDGEQKIREMLGEVINMKNLKIEEKIKLFVKKIKS